MVLKWKGEEVCRRPTVFQIGQVEISAVTAIRITEQTCYAGTPGTFHYIVTMMSTQKTPTVLYTVS